MPRISPLNHKMRMVDEEGRPTPEFLRWWQETLAIVNPLTTEEGVSNLLDVLGAARGSVLVRSEDEWVLLNPGTTGQIIVSQGDDADPIYADPYSTFVALQDTPNSYTDQALRSVRVNAAGTALEFFEQAAAASVWTVVPLLEGNTGAENSALLQTAIDDGDLRIHLPAGNFQMNPVDLVSKVYLRGSGIDNTNLVFPTQTITDVDGFGGVLNVHGTALDPIEGVILSDFTINGNKANITVAGTTDENDIEAVDFRYAHNCHAYRVKCVNTVGDGLDYDECFQCTNHDCQMEGTGGNGNHFSTNSSECTSYGMIATDCGVDNTRAGFDTHFTSTRCGYINPRTVECYRGGYIRGDDSFVQNHYDEGSTANGLRLAASHCSIQGHWVDTASGNAMTIESGSTFNRVDGIARDASASGFNFLSGADRNSVGVTAEGCGGVGLIFSGNRNVARGCVLRLNSGGQYSALGTDNLAGDMITA